MQGRLVSLIAVIVAGGACQHEGRNRRQSIPDNRVAIEEATLDGSSADANAGAEQTPFDPKTFDPRIPINVNAPLSPLAELWHAGATQLLIRISSSVVCEGTEIGTDAYDTEWRLERKTRKVMRSTLRCGQNETQEKLLSPAEFHQLEERILALTTSSHPSPCIDNAPDVSVELLTAQGDSENFKVNYGQCGATLVGSRIDLDGFEKLSARLKLVNF